MIDFGPNTTKLLNKIIAREVIQPGGNIADGIKFFTDSDYRTNVIAKSKARTIAYIQEIRNAKDSPYKNSSNEEIAAVILDKLEAKIKEQNESNTSSGSKN